MNMEQTKGFFESLFDFSFEDLVTTKIIKFLYILSIIGAGLASLFWISLAFSVSAIFGVLMLLIGAPLLFMLSVIYARVLLEIIIVIFRISENTAKIAAQGRKLVKEG
jgi:hypothetical protein